MLEANPRLTWRDLQAVVIESANPLPLFDAGDFKRTGSGFLFSHRFGFGMLDAGEGTLLAQNWTMLPPSPDVYNSSVIDVGRSFGPNQQDLSIFHFPAPKSLVQGEVLVLEHVEVHVNIRHPNRGDVSIILTSPSGTESVFASSHGDRNPDYPSGWRFSTNACWGESPVGDWKMDVFVANGGKSGHFENWSLVLYTHKATDGEIRRYEAIADRTSKILKMKMK